MLVRYARFNRRIARPTYTHPRRSTISTTAAGSSTANADEIAHFSRLSSQWWDERGEFSFLHKMNPVRMKFIREKVVEVARDEAPISKYKVGMVEGETEELDVLRGLDVLDVGCGGGLLSESLARLGANTLGIDASKSNIGIASLHASTDPRFSVTEGRSGSLRYEHTLAESLLSSSSKRYDVVCSMEVLEHVDNPASFLSSCAELVKPGGHLFLSTVSRTPLAYALTILAAEKILRKVSHGTHTYSKFIKPSELIEFFENYRSTPHEREEKGRPWITRTYDHGLPTRMEAEIRGMIYLPWKGQWTLAPRSSPWGAESSYLFWVRKPRD